MIPELGHVAVILGLMTAVTLALIAFTGVLRERIAWVEAAGNLAAVQLFALTAGFACLAVSFLTSDFSVLYVAENSNTQLPWYYKFGAIWGAHEGSFLLWTLMMAAWTFAVANRASRLPYEMHGYVLGTMGILNAAFLLFLLSTSNPFVRLVPNTPLEGADLNPLLQDFGQMVHPPLLYVGYVGFSVVFAFAVAALLTGRLDMAWARWSRPWANIAWAFLTLGIALGSWWAYYEVGWGGWWFWDPVENASFMPWLTGTALVHSLAVTEKRGAFKSWTVLLALITFSLSLVGTFLVRSGILTSVHAFAVDPKRGTVILVILGIVVGSSLLLYALRTPSIRSRLQYVGLSRELLLLINNVLLVVATVTVLLGTLYPLGYEAVTGGEKMSVGPPYFNSMFVPTMLLLTAALAIAPIAKWRQTPRQFLVAPLVILAIAAVCGLVVPLVMAGRLTLIAVLAFSLAGWVIATHVHDVIQRRGNFTMGYIGMTCAHVGFALAVVGITATSTFSHSRDVRQQVGDSVVVNDTEYSLTSIERVEGPNYVADRAVFDVNGSELVAEKRQYPVRRTVTTEAGIRPGFLRDLYISMGEPYPDGSWGFRIQDKPGIRWIWLGAIIVSIAAVIATLDARYRRLKRAAATSG